METKVTTLRGQELCFLSISEAGDLIKKRKLSPVELTRAHLDRIEALDSQLSSYKSPLPDTALKEARKAEGELVKGRYKGPLHGIPVAHKDQYDVKGVPTTGRLHPLKGWTPAEDATAVTKLREAGSVLLGKLVMFGLPMGSQEDLAIQVRNPWNLDYMSGGSSSGSGAALAAGLCMGLPGGGYQGLHSRSSGGVWHCGVEAHLRQDRSLWAGAP